MFYFPHKSPSLSAKHTTKQLHRDKNDGMVVCFVISPSHIIVNNPNCYPIEMCKICKKPFRFSNLDMHIETGCAAALLKEYEEKMKEKELKSEEEEVVKTLFAPKSTNVPVRRGRGRPRKIAKRGRPTKKGAQKKSNKEVESQEEKEEEIENEC